jgi:emfourin
MTLEVSPTMRVKFVQSGGIVGSARACELDSSRLPADDARELHELVQASGILATGEFEKLSSEGRDLRLYEIQVENGPAVVTVTFDDHTLPAQARPLVSFLRSKAKPQDHGQ